MVDGTLTLTNPHSQPSPTLTILTSSPPISSTTTSPLLFPPCTQMYLMSSCVCSGTVLSSSISSLTLTSTPLSVCSIKKEETRRCVSLVPQLIGQRGCFTQVMKLLSSLCVCHDVAIRDNQQLICDHLMYYKDILLHTTMCQKIEW